MLGIETLDFGKTLPASWQIEHLEPPELGAYHNKVHVYCTDSNVGLCFALRCDCRKGKMFFQKAFTPCQDFSDIHL